MNTPINFLTGDLTQLVGKSLDRYQIVALQGQGGMGAVFRALDVTLQRSVALKVMHPQLAQQPDFQERFLQEARSTARLDHPGIVKVFDFGKSGAIYYLVMEFLPGENLRRSLHALQQAGKWIVLTEALELTRQVCAAVGYAHQQGVLHRDIKPDNIMLKPEASGSLPYRPMLTDLGLARLMQDGLTTRPGVAMGTPAYMSPEQAAGEELDARSDVYALGILLYELAVGQLPFPIKTLTEAIRYHLKEPPPPPRTLRPELPDAVAQVILRALHKEPAARYANAQAMANALTAAIALSGEPMPAGTAVSLLTVQEAITPTHIREPNQIAAPDSSNWGGTRAEPAPSQVGLSAGGVGVFSDTRELAMTPGNRIALPLTVLNASPVVDTFAVSVTGIPATWTPSLPTPIRLLPGASQSITLMIQPPRAPQTKSGVYPVAVRVAGKTARDSVGEMQVALRIKPFSSSQVALVPAKINAGKTARVSVCNQGNTPQNFTLHWQDHANELEFAPAQANLALQEGQEGSVKFRAKPREWRLFGGAKEYPFTVQVTGAAESQTQAGQAVAHGLIPLWFPLVLLVMCLALNAAFFVSCVRAPVIRTFTYTPRDPMPGQPVTIYWDVSDADEVEFNPPIYGFKPTLQGQYTFPNATEFPTVLNLRATSRFGSASQPLKINLVQPTATPTPEPKAPEIFFRVSATEVVDGQSVTIEWRVANAESIILLPFGSVEAQGQIVDTPRQSRIYTLTARNKDKTAQRTQEVTWRMPTATPNLAATEQIVASQTASAQQTAQANATLTAAAVTRAPTATPTLTPNPQGNCVDPNARFENITDGQRLETLHAFIGTATADNFVGYLIEYNRTGQVLYKSTTPVAHGSLFVWDTRTVDNGAYLIRLTVYLKDGTNLAPCIVAVQVAH